MADGPMDLETPAEPDAAPVAEVPVVEAPPDPDEQIATEIQGAKLVPLDALKAARAEAKAAKAQIAELEPFRAYAQNAQPYVEFFKNNPQLAQQQPVRQEPAPAGTDPELVEIAQLMDYYDRDGKPDLARAQKHQAYTNRQAERMARSMVEPLARSTAEEKSARNYMAVLNEKLPDGTLVDQNLLTRMWQNLPASYTQDPSVARMLHSAAAGETLKARQPQPAAPSLPALHTEGPGMVPPRVRTTISELERKILNNRGIKDVDYEKATKDFKPGRTSVLED